MEKQTIIFTALPNGLAADGSLRLSVFISPRLWSDDPNVALLKLSAFDDFLDWPARISAATWKVTFAGGPTLNATVESAAPSTALWQALFKNDTDVTPYRFPDYRGAVLETFPSAVIHDVLVGIYSRAASSAGLGAGTKLPTIEALADDPDIIDIARDLPKKTPVEFGPRPEPIDVGGKLPDPEPLPEPPKPPGTGCCLCGCLLWPFLILATPFPKLKARLKQLCSAAEVAAEPALSTEPKPVPSPPPPPLPEPPVVPEPPPVAPGPPSAKRQAFNDLNAFLKPTSDTPLPLPTALELKQKYDFHQMISALGDYPLLLRLFGIVVDLVVPLDGAAPPAEATITVEPTIALVDDSTVVGPRTNYSLTVDTFAALPRPVDPEISNGLLRLNDTNRFQVIQVDVVGGGIKLQAAATNTVGFADEKKRSPNMPENSSLPALRTGGISVIRLNLVSELRDRFLRSHALQQKVFAIDKAPKLSDPAGAEAPLPPTDELFAEDLVSGYRVDVFDVKSNRWHSLCQRVGTYNFLDAPGALPQLQDEGFVQFAATEPLAKPAKTTLRTSDSLFVWDGWSLCAPRYGLSIMPNPDPPKPPAGAPPPPPPPVILGQPQNKAVTNFKLETSFTPAVGSLPRLRFDHEYRLRARVCDLAGNSVFGPNDAAFLNDVAEQTETFHCARYEPVSPPPMMLRAAPVEGESLEHLVVRTSAVGSDTKTTERHIVPPKISQSMAEQHGKFDLNTEKMDTSTTGYDLAKREAGSLEADAIEVKKDLWIHPNEQFKVTYLPDPSSRGALLLGLPGLLLPDEPVEPVPGKRVNKIPFDGPWPDPLPFRLRLVAIPAADNPAEPKWNDVERVLEIQLAESDRKVIQLSSYCDAEDLDRQGVLQWTRQEAPPTLAQVEADTAAGKSWLHMPWRDITLVHAVPKPLEQPTVAVITPAAKNLGETFARIDGTVTTHSASTGKVDLTAEWTDPIDDPLQPKPGTLDHTVPLCEVLIEVGVDPTTTDIRDSAKHEIPIQNFGDTKFHRVTYRPVATTRFREYFPTTITDIPANVSLAGPPSGTVVILNSARPAPPKVLYVVPTYQWEDDPPIAGKVTRTRRGNGLRVYLERGWYSSGDEELLGVVFIEGATFTNLDQKLKRIATHWGADPIWQSSPPDISASQTNFIGAKETGAGLRLSETSQLVSVAGYLPEFDEERQLWFADIEIDPGQTYAPFVRLALARFQPNSLKDAELSRVARAEFAQLAPHRTATVVTTTTPTSASFKVTVTGITYQHSGASLVWPRFPPDRDGRAEIEAKLQKRIPNMGNDPDLGWGTGAEILLTPDPVNPGEWTGELNILEKLEPDTWRILLQEYEWYRSDFQPEENQVKVTFDRRVVYAAAIQLG